MSTPSLPGPSKRVLLEDPSFSVPQRVSVAPILFLPTAEEVKSREAIRLLQDPKVVSPQPIWVLCRNDKRSFYQSLPGVQRVWTYSPDRYRESLKTVWALAGSRVEVISSVFSPDPTFWLQKLLFLLFPARYRLAFKDDLTCYYLKGGSGRGRWIAAWGTLLRVLLRRHIKPAHGTLFLPTDEDSKAVEAIQRLQDPKVAAKGIVVFCREDKRPLYESLPTVQSVWTYPPNGRHRHLRTVLRLMRTRVDLVSAIFSGRPIFRLQKLLFLILRAQNRLVFNENLDCYMLRGNLRQFLRLQRHQRERDYAVLIVIVRTALKGLLFLPRFAYLILWAAFVTARRGYIFPKNSRF